MSLDAWMALGAGVLLVVLWDAAPKLAGGLLVLIVLALVLHGKAAGNL